MPEWNAIPRALKIMAVVEVFLIAGWVMASQPSEPIVILAHPIQGHITTIITTTTGILDPTASTVTITTDGSTSSTTPGTNPPGTNPSSSTTTPLTVDAGAEQTIAASADQVRAALGLSAVTTDSRLHAYARAWASHMAEAGVLSHSDITTLLSQEWQVVGENIAQGADASVVVQALIDSPAHLSIIVDPLYTSDGVGVVVDEQGDLWVVQIFAGEDLVITTSTTTTTLPIDTTLPTVTLPPTTLPTLPVDTTIPPLP